MVVFVVLILILALAATIPISKVSGPVVEEQLNGNVAAQMLVKWHVAATHACASVCQDGPIQGVAAYMPDAFRDALQTGSPAYHSFASGTRIFSYYVPKGRNALPYVMADASAAIFGYVPTDVRSYVGPYRADTMTLQGTIVVPVAQSDGTLVDGVPMIMTNSNVSYATAPVTITPSSDPCGNPALGEFC